MLVEGPAAPEGWLQGLSDHYLRVTFPGPPALAQPPGDGALYAVARGKCWWEKRWKSLDTNP